MFERLAMDEMGERATLRWAALAVQPRRRVVLFFHQWEAVA